MRKLHYANRAPRIYIGNDSIAISPGNNSQSCRISYWGSSGVGMGWQSICPTRIGCPTTLLPSALRLGGAVCAGSAGTLRRNRSPCLSLWQEPLLSGFSVDDIHRTRRVLGIDRDRGSVAIYRPRSGQNGGLFMLAGPFISCIKRPVCEFRTKLSGKSTSIICLPSGSSVAAAGRMAEAPGSLTTMPCGADLDLSTVSTIIKEDYSLPVRAPAAGP
jgi:hypothetical protein